MYNTYSDRKKSLTAKNVSLKVGLSEKHTKFVKKNLPLHGFDKSADLKFIYSEKATKFG